MVVLFALFEDEDAHRFARQHDGLQGVRQFVDVQDRDAVQLRDLVQIEIVGDDDGVQVLRQLKQFQIDFADGRIICVHDLYVERGIRLQTVEHV